jgi:hypothetical protein
VTGEGEREGEREREREKERIFHSQYFSDDLGSSTVIIR